MVATNRTSGSAPRFQSGLPDMSKPSSQQRGGPVCMRASDVKQNSAAREKTHQAESHNAVLPAIELWLCFILGVLCMICGILGLCMASSQAPAPTDTAWLRTAYVPALRVTSVACFLMGAILGRKGWAQP
jgi:hypothetical protein